ncbi:hypothetical protein ABPG75_007404 [Micractinium tetrahymenae]
MAKGKKRKAAPAAAAPAREEPPNLFERLSNKKRFDILGRKVKGETRQLGKLRSAASERRKSTLLVEYKQLRKSNAFIDRRFGEDDESLTADEKALLRFQKQRLKEMAASKFALPDEDEGGAGGEQLTHLGRSLAELEDLQEGWRSDDEGDDALADDVVRNYHFGGGLFEKKQSGAAGGEGGEGEEEGGEEGRPHKKSKKEVMEEIIAKSKAFKAEKQRQREEDQDETAALDDQFRSLLGEKALLGLMRKKGEKRDNKAETEEDKAFDVLTRELVFEAKAKPGERTLTADELAELERQRLEALEAQRKRRMTGDDDEEDEEGGGGEEGGGAPPGAEAAALPAGGYAARRAKRARAEEWRATRLGGDSGDALEDDFMAGSDSEGEDGSEGGNSGSEEEGSEEEGEDGEGLSRLERRRRQRAAGDHPLQEAFRHASAKLLKKHRAAAGEDLSSEEEEEDEEEGEEGSEDEGESSSGLEEEQEEKRLESGSSSEDDDDDEEEEEEGLDAKAAAASSDEEAVAADGEQAGGSGSSSKDEDEEEDGQQEAAAAAGRTQPKAAVAAAPAPPATKAAPALPPGVSADLPYTPPLPDSYEAFAKLVEGRSAADLAELIRRMRVVHAASLNGQNRKGLQLLYGILVQHFASLAGGGRGGRAPPMAHLDALVQPLLELTPQVPFYAATLARARLQRAQQRLAECLRDPELRAEAWPAPRVLLLLKLLATVFPASDKRHPVLTPAGLLACSCLSNCPVAKPQHTATGLFLASLALHLHSQARRFVPEPLAFAVQLLQGALPAGCAPAGAAAEAAAASSSSHQRQLGADEPRWLAIAATDAGAGSLPAAPEDIPPLELAQVLSSGGSGSGGTGEEDFWRSAGFKTSAAAAAVRLVGRTAELLAGNAALPEILAPAQAALRAIVAAAEAAMAAQQQQAAAAAAAPPASIKKKQRKQQQNQPQQQQQQEPQGSGVTASAAPAAILAPGLVELCRATLAALDAAAASAASSRRPLYNVALLKVAEKRQYNPRFEEDFVSGKDYDPDRERSERRKLQRALRREERGAARELRRDGAFMAEVRDREKAAKQAELFASEKRAKSFLQQQQADFKSGGQGGMWKRKKK